MIAKPIFQGIHAQRLLLEYDDERSGSFESLKEVPEDRMVVLGLVTTKSSYRESEEELATRINEASRYIPRERLALSPQCGFSTSIVGNRITIKDEEYKLRIVVETAQAVWG